MPKKGIPLERKIQAARKNCRKLKSRVKQQKCLKPYSQYRWLDNYPLR